MSSGFPWPRISIVTPSYNQGQFIEETIRSVLLQGYPNLEYIVIDGGSTDDSIEIIEKYAPWIAYWTSEPDRGQAHAINKGLARSTGDLLGWINSDDMLLPQAAQNIAAAFEQSPQAVLVGDIVDSYQDGGHRLLLQQKNITFQTIVEPWRHRMRWHQPGVYFPRSLYQQIGLLDEALHYVFDRDWLCRALQVALVHYLGVPVAQFRHHNQSKTMHDGAVNWLREESMVAKRYWHQLEGFDRRLSEATLEVHYAACHLRLRNWARIQGCKHLIGAVRDDWRVLVWHKFWLLCVKALMPLRLLQRLRALYIRFSRRSLWLNY
jgi:glycosyltransferase involved in cell wall biosynthesis